MFTFTTWRKTFITRHYFVDYSVGRDEGYDDLEEEEGPTKERKLTSVADFIDYAWNDAHWLAGLLILLTLLGCFCNHHSDLRQRLVGARMRIACCSAIYRKTLRMSKKAAGQTPAGYLINLLSNDVSRLDYGFIFLHYVWVLPFQVRFGNIWLYKWVTISITIAISGSFHVLPYLEASTMGSSGWSRWSSAEDHSSSNGTWATAVGSTDACSQANWSTSGYNERTDPRYSGDQDVRLGETFPHGCFVGS